MKRSLTLLGAAAFLAASPALGQDGYPTDAVTIVVPYPAGGGTDTVARTLAERLQEDLGQPFVVENRAGAGSLIGVDYAAKADADGYTLLLATSSAVTNVVLGDRQPYDPVDDFDPIRMLTIAPAVLTVNPDFPADDLQGFLEEVRANPDEYTYASYGERTQAHLTALLLQEAGDFSVRHIPYDGGNPAITATISGETDMVIPSVVPSSGPVKNGQLKGLAIASSERSSALPDVPTFKEQELDYEIGTWFGLVAPEGTPEEAIKTLDDTIAEAMEDQEFRNKLQSSGAIAADWGSAEFADFIQSEVDRWQGVLDSGLLD